MNRVACIGLVLATLLAPAIAHAQGCSMTSSGLQFGRYDPSRHAPTDSRADITIRCDGGNAVVARASTVTIALAAAGPTGRHLSGPGGAVRYVIYQDAAHARPWSGGSGDGTTVTASLPPTNAAGKSELHLSAWGRIDAGQWLPSGSYADIVTIDVAF